MKRFLACLLVLILLCGQAALAESPVQYTCGFAMDFEELVFIVNNERIDMPSAHYRLLTTDQFDQVQLSLSMERNGQELLALWAEELPDGNGSLTLSIAVKGSFSVVMNVPREYSWQNYLRPIFQVLTLKKCLPCRSF